MMTKPKRDQTKEQIAKHLEAAEAKRLRKRLTWVLFCNIRDSK
jgi:hypothetical protein